MSDMRERRRSGIAAVVALAGAEATHSGLPGLHVGPGEAYWRILALG